MKQKRYAAEFKKQAVEKLASGEYTLRHLSQELGVSVVTLLKWRNAANGTERTGDSASTDGQDSEIAQLRAELVRLREERDRLRKGIAYLAGVGD